MTILFVILVVLACVVLSLIVLVQNPKGGGLAGNIAGFSNQFMGVKQTTDVLEKGTWIFAAIIGILCITSTLFLSGGTAADDPLQNVRPNPGTRQVPTNSAPFQGTQQQPAIDTNR